MRAQELPLPEPDSGEVTGRADDILSRSEFRQTESFLERAGRWIDELLSDIVGGLAGGGVGSVVAWSILAVLVGAVIWLVVRITPMAGLTRVAPTEALVQTVGPAATDHRTAEQWRAEAQRLAAEGRYDAAVRARYRALLADLIDRGVLDDVPGTTAGEYRVAMGTAGQAAAPFAAATDLFQDVWYGPVEAGDDDLHTFVEHESAVLTETAP